MTLLHWHCCFNPMSHVRPYIFGFGSVTGILKASHTGVNTFT